MNKIDLLASGMPDWNAEQDTVWLSAASGDGISRLDKKLEKYFSNQFSRRQILLPPDAGKIRASLYQHCKVLTETCDEQGKFLIEVELARADIGWLQNQPGFSMDFWIENA